MLQTKFGAPTIYNPASQTQEEIKANFVIRHKEFDELFNAVLNDNMEKPPQHYIIQGQRGYGKTTLLLRLNIELKNNNELNNRLIPVIFNEEQYGVFTLAKLWEEIIDYLEDAEELFAGLSDEAEELINADSPEEDIYKLLIGALKNKGKKLILLIDNFSEMTEKFSRKDTQRLREVLTTCNSIRIIGASATALEYYFDYKQPFYEFFKVIKLKELNKEETIQLLKSLGKNYGSLVIETIIEKQPERIEALRRLTGGVPRTIVLLFGILVDDKNGNSFKDLESMLDKVTPLYKHRLDSLSVQQQAIIDAIAQNWDAISTKEIAKKVRMPSKAVSSQLNQLENNQLVTKLKTSTKNHLYRINEQFFNIYYLMRLGKKKNRNRVLWLVKFFQIWCGENELSLRTKKHIEALHNGALYENSAYYIAEALACTPIPDELQHELLSETKKYLSSQKSSLSKELRLSHLEVKEKVIECLKTNKYETAKKVLLDDGIAKNDICRIIGDVFQYEINDYEKAVLFYQKGADNNDVDSIFSLAFIYDNKLKDYVKAEKYYLKTIDEGVIEAAYNLGLLYKNEFKDYAKAEKYYLMAAGKGVAFAMYNLGLLYANELKDPEKEEKYYLMAVEKGDSKAMYNLGFLYHEILKEYSKAEKYYLMATEKGIPEAMNNLGQLYAYELKDLGKAEKYYLMAVEKGNSKAMYNFGLLYKNELKDFERAEKYYLMAVEKGDSKAMNNLGSLYVREYKDYTKAEKYYLIAIEKGELKAVNNLGWLYFVTRQKKEKALELQKQYFETTKDGIVLYTYIMVLLWNDKIEEAGRQFKIYIENEEFVKGTEEEIQSMFLMFLAKKQYNYVYNLFMENKYDIKDKYKPFFYTAVKLLGPHYNDEFIKMPQEMTETVEEILKAIEQMAIDYA